MEYMPSQPSIAYVLSLFPALSETFIVEELLELKRRGVDLTIFSLKSLKKDEPVSAHVTELMPLVHYSAFLLSWPVLVANLRLVLRHPLRCASLMWRLFTSLVSQPIELVKSFSVVPKTVYFAEVARSRNCSRIHAHFCNVPAAAARLMARILEVPFSCTAHGSDIYKYPPADLVKRIHDASPFITVSEYNRRYLASLSAMLNEDTIEVVHCGVNLNKFANVLRQLTRNRTLRILTVGRLEHVKGLDILMDACALLRDADLDFTCDLVGDGSERAVLEERISQLGLQDYVVLCGALPHEDVIKHYQKADLFVLSSRREGIPVSVMEAMATGLPVVATNVFGLPELVDDGRTGVLVPPEDAFALAEAILRLAQDTDVCGEMARSGRERINEEFSIKRSVDCLLMLWGWGDIANEGG